MRNVGHPPAFPVCLTLNLAAGMRKWREGGIGGVRQTGTAQNKAASEVNEFKFLIGD